MIKRFLSFSLVFLFLFSFSVPVSAAPNYSYSISSSAYDWFESTRYSINMFKDPALESFKAIEGVEYPNLFAFMDGLSTFTYNEDVFTNYYKNHFTTDTFNIQRFLGHGPLVNGYPEINNQRALVVNPTAEPAFYLANNVEYFQSGGAGASGGLGSLGTAVGYSVGVSHDVYFPFNSANPLLITYSAWYDRYVTPTGKGVSTIVSFYDENKNEIFHSAPAKWYRRATYSPTDGLGTTQFVTQTFNATYSDSKNTWRNAPADGSGSGFYNYLNNYTDGGGWLRDLSGSYMHLYEVDTSSIPLTAKYFSVKFLVTGNRGAMTYAFSNFGIFNNADSYYNSATGTTQIFSGKTPSGSNLGSAIQPFQESPTTGTTDDSNNVLIEALKTMFRFLFVPSQEFINEQTTTMISQVQGVLGPEAENLQIIVRDWSQVQSVPPDLPTLEVYHGIELDFNEWIDFSYFNKYKDFIFNIMRAWIYLLLVIGSLKNFANLFGFLPVLEGYLGQASESAEYDKQANAIKAESEFWSKFHKGANIRRGK